MNSFEAYIRSRLWAQPPIKLPPIIRRLSETLPILPQGRLPGGMSVFGRLPAAACAAPLCVAASRVRSSMLPNTAPTPAAPAIPRAKKQRRSVLSDMVGPHLKKEGRTAGGGCLPPRAL